MDIQVACECGQLLKAPREFAGSRAQCPFCGRVLKVPVPSLLKGTEGAGEPSPSAAPIAGLPGGTTEAGSSAAASTAASAAATDIPFEATEIPEYMDPPREPVKPPKRRPKVSYRQMFEALLDPRSIQWMLTLGGGLAVLGLVIWLASLGIFKNVLVLAAVFGGATALVLGSGWWLVLKTRFRVAGRALTMLGCLVAPLNLWFYHSQGLLKLEDNLWLGGLACCLVYIATVFVLRDPLFMYAVEGGLTLTMCLFLAELQHVSDTTYLSMFLLGLGLLSIHVERVFPVQAEIFDRRRFGMPLFWSGQAQVGVALLILFGTQLLGCLGKPIRELLEITWKGNLLTESHLLAGGLWLAGAYAYLYSDLVVRRVGYYIYAAAFCVVLAALSVLGLDVRQEWLLALFALLSVVCNLAASSSNDADRARRALPRVGLILGVLPLLMGLLLHFRATSQVLPVAWKFDVSWMFVVVMLVVAVSNRLSAWLTRTSRTSVAYLANSAAALVVAAAGLLRLMGMEDWSAQAPWLMLVPIGYLLAARMWRGGGPARALGWIAHVTTAVILAGAVISAVEGIGVETLLSPRHGELANLRLGIVFVEASVFYMLAAMIRRRSANVYLAAAAACGALWQFLGYRNVPSEYHTLIYAGLGVLLLVLSRLAGIKKVDVFRPNGAPTQSLEGRGLPMLQAGNGVLSVALLAALLQGLARLATQEMEWKFVGVLTLTILAGLIASVLAPGRWRRLYLAASLALVALDFLMLNVLSHLTHWQKLEIFGTVTGVLLVVLGYVGRFREVTGRLDDGVTVSLWLGGLLASLPLLIATIYHRAPGHAISPIDELALFVVTLLLVVTGYSWQVKATTMMGGLALVAYLIMVIVSLGWRQQIAAGVYLTIGGGVLFICGIVLSIYREKLLQLPERIAKREGLFRVLSWR
ncbi:MAG: hypothetical protein K8T25_02615 [Planctomycetia bacterium]|nr:hypothetical protein [Planctomycetia bacterium]